MGTREGTRICSYVRRARRKSSKLPAPGGGLTRGHVRRGAQRPRVALGGSLRLPPRRSGGRFGRGGSTQRERGQHERQHAPRPGGGRARATSPAGSEGARRDVWPRRARRKPSRLLRAFVGRETRRSENRHPMETRHPARASQGTVSSGWRRGATPWRRPYRRRSMRLSRGVAPFSSRSESRRASRVGAPRRWRVVLVVVPRKPPLLPGRATGGRFAPDASGSSTSTPRARDASSPTGDPPCAD